MAKMTFNVTMSEILELIRKEYELSDKFQLEIIIHDVDEEVMIDKRINDLSKPLHHMSDDELKDNIPS